MNASDLYSQYLIPLIVHGLNALAGTPRTSATDDKAYRQAAIEPIWASLPLPFRVLGREKLRWDEYMLAIRGEAFVLDGNGKLAMRVDAAARLAVVAQRLLSESPGVLTATLAEPPSPRIGAAIPVVYPADIPDVASSVSEPAIGIDLGTTYSVVAYLDANGRPVSIPNAVGEITTPSVVLLDPGGPVVGKEAVLAAALEPEKIAECAKRDMGAKVYRKKVNGEFLPPELIASVILRALKDDAQRKLGKVRDVVITVPAYFDKARRRATIDAGKIAGLRVLDIINEPTAAAIAYGYQLGFLDPKGRAMSSKPLRVLIYDLGGGTIDVTILEIQGNSFKALATDGDIALGGKDWDETIVQYAAEQFIRQHREDPRDNPSSLQDLWLNAELTKKTLTERLKATMFVNHLGVRMKAEISRLQFEEATASLLGRTRKTTEIVVRQAGLSWATIDKVLLVGGSTRMPQVVRMLEELTGRPPEQSLSVDEAVAHGAALYAQLLKQQGNATAGPRQFTVTNVNSHSLGIVGVDAQTGRRRNQILIPKNTPLPHTVTRVFKIQKAGQSQVVIRVVEGESDRPEACSQVGACTVKAPPGLPAGTPVQVSYSYQPNGQLEVRAQIVGHTAPVVAVLQRENALSAEHVQMWNRCIFPDSGE